MADYTESLGLELITPGTQAGLWGTTTNNNLTNVDQAISGITPISFAGLGGTTRTLTSNNGAADEARSAVLNITGTATAGNTIIIPNKQKLYVVRNDTGQSITFKTLTGTVTYVVQAGYYTMVFCNGNDEVYTGLLVPGATTLGVTGGGTGVTTFGAGGILRSAGGTANLFAFPTVSLNTEVAGTLPVGNGGTGASTSAGAPFALKGANSDITALTGLTTPLSANRGGTGASAAPTAGQVPIGVTGGTYTPGTITGSGGTTVTSSSGGIIISSVTGGTGTVTAVSGTGTVNGLTLSGTVTTSGNLTLSGSLSGSAPSLSVGSASTAGTASGLTGSPNITVGQVNINGGGFMGTTSIQLTTSAGTGISTTGGGIGLNCAGAAYYLSITGGNLVSTSATDAYKNGSSTAWIISSDARIKDNVQPYTRGLSEINGINPKVWTYNGKAGSTLGANGIGVIADEIEQVLPSVVGSRKGKLNPDDNQEVDIKNVDVSEITWLLVNAVKELNAKVTALEEQVLNLSVK